jgi:hypothetical protein
MLKHHMQLWVLQHVVVHLIEQCSKLKMEHPVVVDASCRLTTCCCCLLLSGEEAMMGHMQGYAAGMPPMYYPPEYGMPGAQRQGRMLAAGA